MKYYMVKANRWRYNGLTLVMDSELTDSLFILLNIFAKPMVSVLVSESNREDVLAKSSFELAHVRGVHPRPTPSFQKSREPGQIAANSLRSILGSGYFPKT